MGEFALEKYASIQMDGVTRQGEELQSFCMKELRNEYIPQWLRDIYTFILEWLSPDDFVAAHTSGSTGMPKLIRLQKRHMVASAQKTIQYFELTPDKTALLCLSANYIAGKMMLVRAMVGGFNLLLSEPTGTPLMRFTQPIDFVAMVPLQVFNSLADFNDHIKDVIIGGGAVSSGLSKCLEGMSTRFYETYGMTETVSHVAIKKIGDEQACFRAMPNVAFQLDDRGCLKIIAHDICEGEIITNDIVRLRGDQEFVFLGRYDHVINSGGVKILPEEVERKLAHVINIPFVISSLADEKLGEMVVLVVEEKAELMFDLPDAAMVLSRYECPKKILRIQQFPFTQTGKVKRGEVKAWIDQQ